MSKRRCTAALMAALMAGTVSLAYAAAPQPAFLNGGVGKEDAARMHAAAKDYSLQIECSEKRDNEFIADAHVKIVDAHGKTVFRRADAGPIMLVRLPPGSYRVTARADGRDETQTATITPHHTSTLYFHWQGASRVQTPGLRRRWPWPARSRIDARHGSGEFRAAPLLPSS